MQAVKNLEDVSPGFAAARWGVAAVDDDAGVVFGAGDRTFGRRREGCCGFVVNNQLRLPALGSRFPILDSVMDFAGLALVALSPAEWYCCRR